ncbi:hypothetical protein RirG_256590 [Rhizophagus irregularis DAOM 197198w]|nr:hypothetical protein RirG_256590 [Rhizophagus irregularis DAOM 197198w]
MIGVAKKVFPFLIVLFLIISGFAHAFFILLKPNKNDDDNSINPDGTTLIQSPNSNTNMFSLFPTSLLAMYLLLIGNSDSLSPWTSHQTPPSMAFFLVLFTFFTVIYLMNLFIGLLNVAIENYDKNEEFLLQKAKIIMEIELFYMLPYQRCNKKWFPDWIHYDIPVNKVYKLINAIDNNRTEFNSPPFISNRLRNLLKIPEPINENKSFEELKQQMRDEFKQQIKDMQELLNSFIKNSNTYHVNTK